MDFFDMLAQMDPEAVQRMMSGATDAFPAAPGGAPPAPVPATGPAPQGPAGVQPGTPGTPGPMETQTRQGLGEQAAGALGGLNPEFMKMLLGAMGGTLQRPPMPPSAGIARSPAINARPPIGIGGMPAMMPQPRRGY